MTRDVILIDFRKNIFNIVYWDDMLCHGDNCDCCCIQVATCDANGLWQVGALKHNYVALETYPFISPLFTATRYRGELSPDELILAELRDFIGGSEEKGRIIWDYLARDDRSETDLRNYIKSFISMKWTMAT